jgi:HPt (histidine-containing phosphotransfer) domain-containing protein
MQVCFRIDTMNTSPIDPTTFAELQDTAGTEFVSELVQTFLEEAPQMLDEMDAALSAGSAEAFRRAAHSLKSNANTFGASRLGEMARALELGGLPADGNGVAALRAEYDVVAAELQERCRG